MSNTKKSAQSGSPVDLHRLVRLFVVLYDDGEAITLPMQWDEECEGALRAWMGRGKIASFATRQDARKAIRISTKWNQLLREQGKTENTDFTDSKQFLRVEEIFLPNDQAQPPRTERVKQSEP